MTRKPAPPPSPERRQRGFEPASGLIATRLRTAGEARGFAVTRLLTHWAEIVGDDLSAVTRPVRMGYGREGLGATLTVLVQGAMAPVVEMQKARIRDRVNACYGYNAVARITLTQTSGAGFAEGQAAFAPAPKAPVPPSPDPAIATRAAATADGVRDDGLRTALETLARNVLSRPRK
ncbi:MAG: DUF721 domain-containing protein [Paracoccaceae bacterium]|nr:MAG: DUF721 domain-containing protein [Paracoccaceae bacterium]